MHYVIVGSSAAATAAAKSIRRLDNGGRITIISKDGAFFSRCQLHLLAAGRRTAQQADFMPADWQERERIEVLWNTEVVGIDTEAGRLSLGDASTISYDRLLIATGSRSWAPPIEGLAGAMTFGLRDMSDAESILAALPGVKTVSIIGAGLVGCELAAELSQAGKKVNIIELAPYPLPMQLEQITGAHCAELMQSAGISLFCSRKVVGVERDGNGNPESVLLDDGSRLASDMIVAAAGVRPNIEWLADSLVATDPKGILINEYGQTSVENVFAAGDVTVMEDVLLRAVMPSPIWPTAVHQGRIAGMNMAGGCESLTRNTGFRASVRLLGTNIVSLGPVSRPDPAWEKQEISYTNSRGQNCAKVIYFENNQIRAAILWGDITDAGVYAEVIINQRDLPHERSFAAVLDGAKFGQEEKNLL